MMYDELVKRLRDCTSDTAEDCAGCPYQGGYQGTYCMNGLITDAADAIENLDHIAETYAETVHELEDKNRWIPVTERLPENDQDVLVMVHWRDYPEDMMCYGRKYKTRWYLWNGELGEIIKGFDITHWMPLPEPPKEET